MPQRTGSRLSREDYLAPARSLARMISIPLPQPSSSSKHQQGQTPKEELPVIDNLMSFDEMDEGDVEAAERDDFANLASLEPGLSRSHTNGS